jgi:small subunit ribosomal protein S1
MSESTTKRKRMGGDPSNATKVQIKEAEAVKEEVISDDVTDDFFNDKGEFDWEGYEATCPSRARNHNSKVNAPRGVKILSKEPYAQDFLNAILGYEADANVVQKIQAGEIYDGTIYSINNEWTAVDIGYRQMVYVNMLKEEASIRKQLTPDASVKVQVLATETASVQGYVLGSISAGVKTAIIEELMESIKEGTSAYEGKVTEMIPGGGYVVEVNGIECFMPGSLAGINKLVDFESILGETMYVVPVSFSDKRGTIVVSHREYLKAMIPNTISKIEEDLTAERTGQVTGSAKYGIFVEFEGCLTGMIHVNDLTPEWTKKHKSREVEPGEDITFKVKEVVSNTKIILTQLEHTPKVDAWDGVEERIKVPAEIVGTVKTTKDYGLFVEIEKGITGLLHISEIEDVLDITTVKPGDKVTVQVTRIDSATRKVFLKM